MASLLKTWGSVIRPSGCNQITPVRWRRWKLLPEKDDFRWAKPLVVKHLREQRDGKPEPKSPTKLLMVYRTKSLFGRPGKEKELMKSVGLHEKVNKMMIHKNTPAVISRLKKIQHLIKVIPVQFPNGEPTNLTEAKDCLMQDDGNFVIRQTLKPASVSTTTEEADPVREKWHLDTDTLQRSLQRKLNTYRFHQEYFKPKYVYKYNQDGKEHRYKGDTNIGADKEWF